MKCQRTIAVLCTAAMVTGALTACTGGNKLDQTKGASDNTPTEITLVTQQVGEIPAKGNEIEQAIEKYTNSKLNIQWVPNSAYTDKINVMIASGELPKILTVGYTPPIINAIKSDTFWELGPYLKDYKNLSEVQSAYYENIKVDGKIYGVPIFRPIARSGIVYRKDWFDALGIKPPVTLDDWYNAIKAITLNDPDKNGKNDTFGFMLDKKYLDSGSSSTIMTRFAVSQGAPNRWKYENGKMIPDFMTKEYVDVLKLFRRLYAEKLINQDFAALDLTEVDNAWNTGRVGIRTVVATNASGYQDTLKKTVPNGIVDVTPLMGPQGIRVASDSGNNGFLAIPKSSVKTEAELRKILTFMDKLLDEPMSTLLARGIEGKHFVKEDGKAVYKDFSLFMKEVKPYRDKLLSMEEYYGGKTLPWKGDALETKSRDVTQQNEKYAVANPTLNLSSATYTEIGAELDQMIIDAQTKYIMGKIDDAGFQAEIEKWKKAGGDKMSVEFAAEYAKMNKK